MKHIDVRVPLDAGPRAYLHKTPFTVEPITRSARLGSSDVATLHMSAHHGTDDVAPRHALFSIDAVGVAASGTTCQVSHRRGVAGVDLRCPTVPLVGSGDAPARATLCLS